MKEKNAAAKKRAKEEKRLRKDYEIAKAYYQENQITHDEIAAVKKSFCNSDMRAKAETVVEQNFMVLDSWKEAAKLKLNEYQSVLDGASERLKNAFSDVKSLAAQQIHRKRMKTVEKDMYEQNFEVNLWTYYNESFLTKLDELAIKIIFESNKEQYSELKELEGRMKDYFFSKKRKQTLPDSRRKHSLQYWELKTK